MSEEANGDYKDGWRRKTDCQAGRPLSSYTQTFFFSLHNNTKAEPTKVGLLSTLNTAYLGCLEILPRRGRELAAAFYWTY